jgi:hypothetical protein
MEAATDPRVFTKDGVRHVQMDDWLRKIPPLSRLERQAHRDGAVASR